MTKSDPLSQSAVSFDPGGNGQFTKSWDRSCSTQYDPKGTASGPLSSSGFGRNDFPLELPKAATSSKSPPGASGGSGHANTAITPELS